MPVASKLSSADSAQSDHIPNRALVRVQKLGLFLPLPIPAELLFIARKLNEI